jgi:hypothetical protein
VKNIIFSVLVIFSATSKANTCGPQHQRPAPYPACTADKFYCVGDEAYFLGNSNSIPKGKIIAISNNTTNPTWSSLTVQMPNGENKNAQLPNWVKAGQGCGKHFCVGNWTLMQGRWAMVVGIRPNASGIDSTVIQFYDDNSLRSISSENLKCGQ